MFHFVAFGVFLLLFVCFNITILILCLIFHYWLFFFWLDQRWVVFHSFFDVIVFFVINLVDRLNFFFFCFAFGQWRYYKSKQLAHYHHQNFFLIQLKTKIITPILSAHKIGYNLFARRSTNIHTINPLSHTHSLSFSKFCLWRRR